MSDLQSDPELEQAARQVAQRRRELSNSVREVEASSERVAHQLKPALLGVAVAAGALAVVGGVVLVARARRRRVRWLPPPQPSALGQLARNVGVALLRVAARHAARALVERVATTPAEPPLVAARPAQ